MLKRRDYQEFIMECDQLLLSTSSRLGSLQGCIFINSEILRLLYFLISSIRINQIQKKYITFFLNWTWGKCGFNFNISKRWILFDVYSLPGNSDRATKEQIWASAALVEIQYLEWEKREMVLLSCTQFRPSLDPAFSWGIIHRVKDKMELIQKKAACVLWGFESPPSP